MATSASSADPTCSFDRATVMKQFEENGYAVIPNVIPPSECDKYIGQYKTWMEKFDTAGKECNSRKSVIQSYRIGHFATTWEVRLKAKPVFAKIWSTEKLLSSADAVAISKPPEQDNGDFFTTDMEWLHLDQGSYREGLHAFQGAVNLEECSETDHCFRVMAHSNLYHKDFFQTFPFAAAASRRLEFYRLKKKEKEWYSNRGCKRTKVPVPKGGMVLWDSRTVHDNVYPVYGRPNKDRWRFVVFVSMTPAMWAGPEDIAKKNEAYEKLLITSHWSSQGLKTFKPYNTKKDGQAFTIESLPDIARTKEAKLLFGIEEYDFKDGKPNGPDKPKWV